MSPDSSRRTCSLPRPQARMPRVRGSGGCSKKPSETSGRDHHNPPCRFYGLLVALLLWLFNSLAAVQAPYLPRAPKKALRAVPMAVPRALAKEVRKRLARVGILQRGPPRKSRMAHPSHRAQRERRSLSRQRRLPSLRKPQRRRLKNLQRKRRRARRLLALRVTQPFA